MGASGILGRTTSAWRPSRCSTTRALAALLDGIPGCPKGFRVLTSFFGGRRQNTMLGIAPDLDRIELSDLLLRDFQQICDHPLAVDVVDSGPTPTAPRVRHGAGLLQ